MRNKTRLSLVALVLLLCFAAACMAGCTKKEPTPAPTEPTETTQTTQPTTEASSVVNENISDNMKSLNLSASVWSSSNGATITLEAVPVAYNQNQAVYFVVHLNGEKVQDLPCTWNGKSFTASADLEAADGYEYECILFEGQGEGESYVLSDAYDSLIYLETSLAAYCNLYVSDFQVVDNQFNVTAGFAHVQLPQLTVGGAEVKLTSSELVFQLNGSDIDKQALELPAGEGSGSHEASLSSIRFNMPQMEDDYQLDLILKVTLSDGQELMAHGGSWFYNNGELRMSAG